MGPKAGDESVYVVNEDWSASYPDPIKLSAGERIELDGRRDIWDGHVWLWAKNVFGKEGWIPDSLVSTGDYIVAREDYSAIELSCYVGEQLTVSRCLNGWAWCQNELGKRGWVPERNLTEMR